TGRIEWSRVKLSLPPPSWAWIWLTRVTLKAEVWPSSVTETWFGWLLLPGTCWTNTVSLPVPVMVKTPLDSFTDPLRTVRSSSASTDGLGGCRTESAFCLFEERRMDHHDGRGDGRGCILGSLIEGSREAGINTVRQSPPSVPAPCEGVLVDADTRRRAQADPLVKSGGSYGFPGSIQ